MKEEDGVEWEREIQIWKSQLLNKRNLCKIPEVYKALSASKQAWTTT